MFSARNFCLQVFTFLFTRHLLTQAGGQRGMYYYVFTNIF